MNAGNVWKQFGQTVRPLLDADPRLQQLGQEVLNGLHERLLLLVLLISCLIRQFIHRMPEAPGFWYDDDELARRYSGAQAAVVPVRMDIANRLAEMAWTGIEETLKKHPIAYVLDLGTGDGIMARTLLATRPATISRERIVIVASDRSSAMLTTHAQTFDEHGILTMAAEHGDMRGETWSLLSTYREKLGTAFDGFDVVLGMMCFHILPKRDTQLYPLIAQLLRPGGMMLFSHDFFRPGEDWSNYAPANTLVEGYQAYAQATSHPISFVSYLAGFLLRRGILQGDRLCTLNEELEAVRRTFTQVTVEQHNRYREFAVLMAGQHNLPEMNPHLSFINGLES